jgi:hypothetical protein
VTALLIPLLLTALVAVSQAPAVERSAQERAERALGEAGLDTVRVVVDGRRVLARVPRGTRDAKVRATLLAVPGIWLVGTVPRTAPSPDGARTHREGGARAVRRQAPAGERSR